MPYNDSPEYFWVPSHQLRISMEAVLGWVRIFIGMAQYKVRGITCKAHATCSRILECAYTSTQAQIFTSADVYAHSEILCFNSLTAMPAQTSHERPWFCAVCDVITLSDNRSL